MFWVQFTAVVSTLIKAIIAAPEIGQIMHLTKLLRLLGTTQKSASGILLWSSNESSNYTLNQSININFFSWRHVCAILC